jgi:hypothetical protein
VRQLRYSGAVPVRSECVRITNLMPALYVQTRGAWTGVADAAPEPLGNYNSYHEPGRLCLYVYSRITAFEFRKKCVVHIIMLVVL